MVRKVPTLIQFHKPLDIPDKRVFIPEMHTVGFLMQTIRSKWLSTISSNTSLFLFFYNPIEDTSLLQPVTNTLAEIEKHMGYPQHLTIIVQQENTFG